MDLENSSLPLEDREKIIEKANEYVGYGDVQTFLKPNDTSYKLDFIRPYQIYETDKFVIVFTAKGGSSLINRVLKENSLFMHSVSDEVMRKYDNFINITTKRENISETELLEFVKCLDGKSEKDLIVVTRNPICKFMSGVIQDLEFSIGQSPIIETLIKEIEKEYFLNADYNKLNIISKLLYYHFLTTINKTGYPISGHATLFNETFFQLLITNPKINRNKLKIVDIDDSNHNLLDVMGSYYPDAKESDKHNFNKTYWTHRRKWEYVYRNLKGNLEKNNAEWISILIETQISRDYNFYRMLLEEYKESYWKPNV